MWKVGRVFDNSTLVSVDVDVDVDVDVAVDVAVADEVSFWQNPRFLTLSNK